MARRREEEADAAALAALNVSLPGMLRTWVDERVAAGGFGSVSEYIRLLIREDRERHARLQRFEDRLLDDAESRVSERARAEGRLAEALDLFRTAREIVEQNVRRENPEATDSEITAGLTTWNRETAPSEEAPGFVERSPKRLKKLLHGKD
jgi:putative addiction module CopG family antidote